MPQSRLGEILVQNRLITPRQLELAMEKQRFTPGEPLGQILCRMGCLKSRDLQNILDQYKKRLKLGEILVARKLVSEVRLDGALKVSREEKIPLGQALMRQHLLNEEQLARSIAIQHDLPYMNLADTPLDPEFAGLVNALFAQRLGIVPLGCRDGSLVIAMAGPIQRDELARLESWCKMPIVPVIARESEILTAQQRLFKTSRPVGPAKLQLELSEDQDREGGKSKYVREVIAPDVDHLVKRIISTGIKVGTSDIHLECGESGMSLRYRVDGILQHIDLGGDAPLINIRARQIVSRIKIMCGMDIAERRRPQDSSFKMKVTREGAVRSVDFRVSSVPTPYGENVVIRILDKNNGVITLEGLGYPPEIVAQIHKALDHSTGTFLVTGPTGSGKSSTLYAVLSHINTPGAKTITVEDPIEYTIDGVVQTEVNEVIGNSFARMLRSFLRQDPDNIMVGEIRDLETASIATRAALTGHAVFSTLHTTDSTSAVTRLLDMGVEPGLLADTLRCVLAQRLVRRICGDCKESYAPAPGLLDEFGIPPGSMALVHGSGCPACHFTGFSGRLPIVELWIPTREELLLLGRRPDNMTLRNQVFSKAGRFSLAQDGLRRVKEGETTLEELLRAVPYEQIEAVREQFRTATGGWSRGAVCTWPRQVA